MELLINIDEESYNYAKKCTYNQIMITRETIANGKPLEQESSYNSVNSLVESKLKNPKAKTFDILHFVADNAGLSTFEAIEKAYIMGVSEQEPILDKIRAEIEEYKSRTVFGIGIKDLETGKQVALDSVLGIIDKYKAESEDRE